MAYDRNPSNMAVQLHKGGRLACRWQLKQKEKYNLDKGNLEVIKFQTKKNTNYHSIVLIAPKSHLIFQGSTGKVRQ